MNDNGFEALFSILKVLEKEDLKNSDISTAINRLVDSFEEQLTPEQKLLVSKEFLKYVKREKLPELPDFGRENEGAF